jgi:DNA polymerase III epsilon subunit family exonuclease
MNEYISLDVETTGLNAYSGRIVEIGAVRFHESGEEISRFECLVNPGIPIPKDATDIHGITDDNIHDCPYFHTAFKGFVDWVYQETPGIRSTYYMAHKAQFDTSFFNREIERNIDLIEDRFQISVIDTLALARKGSTTGSNSLSSLVSRFNIQSNGFHRSIQDCLYLKEVFFKLNGPREFAYGKLPKYIITSMHRNVKT